jgi:hypothetical protein
MKLHVKNISRIALIFALGYIIGSIHAPFELKLRKSHGLPEMGYTLPEREAMDKLFEDNLK